MQPNEKTPAGGDRDEPTRPLRAISPREEVLTVEQAAAELGVSPAVIYSAVKAGMIQKIPLPGRLIRIPRSKFEQYKAGQLDEHGERRVPTERQREIRRDLRSPMERQRDLLKGVKPVIQRREKRDSR